jgi:hypothetical protein
LFDTCIRTEKGADMQQALRPYAVAGIAILGTGSFMAFSPVAPPLPDVHVPAIQLTSDSGLLGDFSSLFGDVTGGTSGIGGLGDLTGDLTGLLGGLNPSSLLSDPPGVASVDPAPADSSLLTPYIELFTNSFTNLQTIGSEWVTNTLPLLQETLQAILANPSLIAELPQAVFSTLSTPATITTELGTSPLITVMILLGAPLVLGLAEAGPLATSAGAFEAFFTALSSGDPTTVLTQLIDGPADIANAFLNGIVPPGLDVLGQPLNLLDGILVPDTSLNVDVDLSTVISALESISPTLSTLDPALGLAVSALITTLGTLDTTDVATITVGPFGGLTDALVNYVPEQIAKTLLADPTTAGTGLTGLLDPSTLLSGLDLGNLGGLLDPSTLLGDLTALLPGAAADVPAQLATDLATLIPF